MGMDVGRSLKGLDAEIDVAAFSLAVSHVVKGEDTVLKQEDSAKIKQAFFRKKQEAQVEKNKAVGEKNSKEGAAFLAENAKKTV